MRWFFLVGYCITNVINRMKNLYLLLSFSFASCISLCEDGEYVGTIYISPILQIQTLIKKQIWMSLFIQIIVAVLAIVEVCTAVSIGSAVLNTI